MVSKKNWEGMRDFFIERASKQNTLEILKQERRETVLVNALAYFLHPRQGGEMLKPKHKILKNLIKETGQHYIDDDYESSTGNLLCLKTEFPCYEGPNTDVKPKRLDIFLEFEKHCIGIEVKVDANVTNDLETYRKRVKERADARGCEYTTILLLTKEKQGKLKWDEEKYPNGSYEWPVITWGDITKSCDLNKDLRQEDVEESIESLLSALKKIDEEDQDLKLKKLFNIKPLKKKADALLEELTNKGNLEGMNCQSWDGDGIICSIVEPRVVIESTSRKFVIDICIGFRGVQFIVFNAQKYEPELYKKVCKKYSFFYWQDYSDSMEHFDRYLLINDTEGRGPKFSSKPRGVEDEDTVFFEEEYSQDSDDWIKKVNKEIEKILELKDV